jgi:hypothetical protein
VLAENHAVAKRLAEVEKTLVTHDVTLRDIYQRINRCSAPARTAAQKK